ncbi:hypothetical protein [Pseudomonas tohonis]|uniref:hypothetical protein n=1 Tax=Pseudomonas tohonis TaxID=2725477 RepID=UPI00156464E4|nr:hypothetical protein [Pseudomonas tohonis]UXY55989.1 hypothetical protein N9L84_22690 [Pseudomonas tohonis]
MTVLRIVTAGLVFMMFSSIGNTTPFRFSWQLAYQVHAFDRYIDDFPPKIRRSMVDALACLL